MTSLNVGNNGIPIENMNEIIAIVEAKPAMKVLCGVPFRDKTITELDISGQRLGVEGALVIRRYLENNGALTSLNISNNKLTKGKLKKKPSWWKESHHRTYGRDDDQYETDMTGITTLADGIKNNGALTSLNLAKNRLGAKGANQVAAALPECK